MTDELVTLEVLEPGGKNVEVTIRPEHLDAFSPGVQHVIMLEARKVARILEEQRQAVARGEELVSPIIVRVSGKATPRAVVAALEERISVRQTIA